MLTWLAVWLQQTIAVVLLAGFIDLLIPNKSMQRYVRLVSGLIVLLTILTPIIRVLQGDFSAKLDANVDKWIRDGSSQEIHMPTLQDIEEGAKALQEKQEVSTANLAGEQLSEAMKAGIEQTTGYETAAVEVKLATDRNGKPTGLESVLVMLKQTGQLSKESVATPSSDGSESSVTEVESVEVTVQPLVEQDTSGSSMKELRPATEAAATAVKVVLKAGWSVNPSIVNVLEQAPD